MEVQIAVIEHRHGTDVYVAKTFNELVDKVFRYCEDNWYEMESSEKIPEDKREAINTYFNEMAHSESLNYTSDSI